VEALPGYALDAAEEDEGRGNILHEHDGQRIATRTPVHRHVRMTPGRDPPMDGVASPAQDDAWANDRDREPPVSVQVHQVLLDDGFRSGIGGDALRPRARRGSLGDGAVRETRVVDRDRRRVDEALD